MSFGAGSGEDEGCYNNLKAYLLLLAQQLGTEVFDFHTI
jgi:hypothetical protein